MHVHECRIRFWFPETTDDLGIRGVQREYKNTKIQSPRELRLRVVLLAKHFSAKHWVSQSRLKELFLIRELFGIILHASASKRALYMCKHPNVNIYQINQSEIDATRHIQQRGILDGDR